MSYSFNAQSKGVKILLQLDREDYGTYDNPTYMMNGVIQCPPGTFGCMGVETMYFQQPSLFPSAYLNTTLKVTEKPFPDNVPDTGMVFLIISGLYLNLGP